MQVTRLEIFGFKSFMDRIILPLQGGVTGIVGPNGCGKSNVVDALRWVLGETRASSLRGGVLEDVIFNGTDKLRPLGLAEVSLTLRASGASIYDDIVQSDPASHHPRVKDASADLPAEGPAATNGNTVAGGAPPGNSVKEAAVTAARPRLVVLEGGRDSGSRDRSEGQISEEDRFESEEEARIVEGTAEQDAGEPQITAPELTESEGPSPAEMLLHRFGWLRSVVEVQVTRRLYRSGESEFFINKVSCRLKDIKEFFRAVGMGARAYTIVAQGEVGRIVTSKPEERRLIIEEAAGIAGFRERLAEAKRRLDETQQNSARLDDVIKELRRQVASLRRMSERARSRHEIKQEMTQLEESLFVDAIINFRKIKSERALLLEQLHGVEGEQNECVAALVEQEETLLAELESYDARGSVLRNSVAEVKDELNRRHQARTERRGRLNEVKSLGEARVAEIKRLEERLETLVQRRDDIVTEIADLESQDQALSEEIAGYDRSSEEELRTLAQSLHTARHELRAAEHAVRELRDRLHATQGKLHATQEQVVASSPLTQLGKSLGNDLLKEVAPDATPLLEGIRVPQELAKAAQAVLGERAKFLVVADPHATGERFITEVESRNKERKGLGLGVVRRGTLAPNPPLAWPLPRLLEQLEVQPDYMRGAILSFGNVYVARSLSEAREAYKALPSHMPCDVTVVTLQGEIVTKDSFFSLRHEGGLLQLKVKEEELTTTLQQLTDEHKERADAREVLQERVAEIEKRHAEVLRESQQRQAAVRELGRKQGSIRGRLHSERRLVVQLDHDINQANQQVAEGTLRLQDAQDRTKILEDELAELLQESDSPLEERLRELTQQLQGFEHERSKRRTELSSVSREVSVARKSLDELRQKLSSVRLEQQKAMLEEQSAIERFVEHVSVEESERLIGIVEAGEGEVLEADARRESQERLRMLRARVQREGEVDPSTIEQYESENARLEELMRQRQDLDEAANQLSESVAHITNAAQQQFMTTFRAIQERFSVLIPRLFGGGRGELSLTNTDAPLDGGVDITVRPPGKKPKSIDLLSGGEKALSATAMIVSMFLERPSPLCVLDEVDAPLDEANLLRFLDLIKEMSAQTQFLVITHNKQSMVAAGNLVGVTMQEPGASKIITVSLQEAFSHVA